MTSRRRFVILVALSVAACNDRSPRELVATSTICYSVTEPDSPQVVVRRNLQTSEGYWLSQLCDGSSCELALITRRSLPPLVEINHENRLVRLTNLGGSVEYLREDQYVENGRTWRFELNELRGSESQMDDFTKQYSSVRGLNPEDECEADS